MDKMELVVVENTMNLNMTDFKTEVAEVMPMTVMHEIEPGPQGARGLRGDIGPQGERGEEAYDNLPDLILIYENQQI